MNDKKTLATVWLDGCSGCHMSFLDMDEALLQILGRARLVYSPLVDCKKFPEHVDITLVEGAIGNAADLEKLELVRAHTDILVALGDCAVTANVPAMRNPIGLAAVLDRVNNGFPHRQPESVPPLSERARPVHTQVPVDVFVPGCPPSASTIHYVLMELLSGKSPDISTITRFGA